MSDQRRELYERIWGEAPAEQNVPPADDDGPSGDQLASLREEIAGLRRELEESRPVMPDLLERVAALERANTAKPNVAREESSSKAMSQKIAEETE